MQLDDKHFYCNVNNANVNKADATCQKELFEIRHDKESKTNFDICKTSVIVSHQQMNDV